MTEAPIPGLPAAVAALAALRVAGTTAAIGADCEAPLVSVAVVTCRPDFAEDALANFLRQAYPRRELVVVVNAGSALLRHWRRVAAGKPEVRVYHAPDQSLGDCRNLAASMARGEFVAMFDDDDLYGPGYVAEAVTVLRATGAAMVTKLEYIWLDGNAGIFRYSRPPGPWSHSHREAGACTQVFRRIWHSPASDMAYSNDTPGEDYAFSRAIAARGGLIVASGPGHFIRRRNLQPGHVHAWNGKLGSFRLEAQERLEISAIEAGALAGISLGS